MKIFIWATFSMNLPTTSPEKMTGSAKRVSHSESILRAMKAWRWVTVWRVWKVLPKELTFSAKRASLPGFYPVQVSEMWTPTCFAYSAAKRIRSFCHCGYYS